MKILSCIPGALFLITSMSAQIMYVGTYTAPQSTSKGIYAYRFDSNTGKMSPLGLMAETPDPTFLAMHPGGKYLYAINEVDNYQGKKAGSVSAFSVDHATGKLTLLNTVSSASPGPCHIVVDATGKAVLVANYSGGSFSSFPVLADGKLGEAASFIQDTGGSVDKSRQMEPHGHSVVVTKNNKFVLGGDLGTDKVMIFKLDPATAKMTPNDPPFAPVKPGSGPRHLVLAPDQKHVYVISEMASTITTFTFNENTGQMKEIGSVSTLPANYKGESTTAEIMIDSKGHYVYGSNRGHDSIAVFAVDPATALLKQVEVVSSGGSIPRAFVIDPSGNYIIAGNQKTNNIAVLKIDHATGKLTPVGDKVELGAPVAFAFVK